MTAIYFTIAVLALIGAGVLLWLDRQRVTEALSSSRSTWGEQHNFRYRAADQKLRLLFHRATMNTAADVPVTEVSFGTYYGEETVVFDLGDEATLVAIRRTTSSNVVMDLRHEDAVAPEETDVELLGAIGPRVMFTSHPEIGRRVCDRRMVELSVNAPNYVDVLWNEGAWTIGSMPKTGDTEKVDELLETVRRFTDLLRVLPPANNQRSSVSPRDPSAPTSRGRRGLEEPKTVQLMANDDRHNSLSVPFVPVKNLDDDLLVPEEEK